MSISVLIVDDSSVVRGLLSRALSNHSKINILDTACDGRMAVDMAKRYQPDIILLDLVMPIMDGFTALPLIINVAPKSKIIVISASPQSLEKIQALGAVDCIEKSNNREDFYADLINRIYYFADSKNSAKNQEHPPEITNRLRNKSREKFQALAIVSSTGGPRALRELLSDLKGALSHITVFITQHIQANFTSVLSSQLSQWSGIPCVEARDGAKVKPGTIYLAPNGAHMMVRHATNDIVIALSNGPPINSCKPSADPMLESLGKVYGSCVLATVLTGMGKDGAEGAKKLSDVGGTVIVQDMESSVVFGMPKAVAELGIAKAILPLAEMAPYIRRIIV